MRLDRLPPDDASRALALAAAMVRARRGSVAGPLSWAQCARAEQLPPPGDWRTWMMLGGRGVGKTRAGAETINGWARVGKARLTAVIAQTEADVRDISMRALRAAAGPGVLYIPSRHQLLRWSNGAEALGFSAEDPDSLRGYEFDAAWCDELAAWRYPEAFDQLQFGLRVGAARQIITTTPRPSALIRAIRADPSTVVTHGRTLDNAANLDQATLRYLLSRYDGSRLGRQELDAELLDDVPGALWDRDQLDALRVRVAPSLVRLVVAIDPATTSGLGADETGIVVAGLSSDNQGYVVADYSGRFSPDGWARRAVDAYRTFGADRIVAEVNQGGDLVESTLRTVDPAVPYRAVHASRGKRTRAEPVAALYEQGRVHHVGTFPALDDQLCAALPEGGTGPDDRLDALVWALTELDLPSSGLDLPGAEEFGRGVWLCGCGHRYGWEPGRLCPTWCGRRAPTTYDAPVDPASLS